MRTRTLLVVALLLFPLAELAMGLSNNEAKPDGRLPAGTYGGCSQKMRTGPDGTVTYGDRLSLSQIRIDADGSLHATFPTAAGSNEELHLQAADAEHSQPVWTAQADGRNYKAKAIRHAEETFSFRLEVHRDGELVAGSQFFCAICQAKRAE
jgi:hypothetical protein